MSGRTISVVGTYSCDRPVQQLLPCETSDWGEFVVGQAYLVYADAYLRDQGDNTFYASVGVAGASKLATDAEAVQDIRDLSAIVRAGPQVGMPIAGAANRDWLYFAGLGWLLCSIGLMLRRVWTGPGHRTLLTPDP